MEMAISFATGTTTRAGTSAMSIYRNAVLVNIERTHSTGRTTVVAPISCDAIIISRTKIIDCSSAYTRATGSALAPTGSDASTGTTTAVATGTTVTRVNPFTIRIIS